MSKSDLEFRSLDNLLVAHAQHVNSVSRPLIHQSLWRGQGRDWPLTPTAFRNGPLPTKKEREIIESFALANLQNPDGALAAQSLWEISAIGQHLGLPTRLLDWSRSPRVALWFAVGNVNDDAKDGVVWWAHTPTATSALWENQTEFPKDPWSINESYEIYETRVSHSRIRAQQGVFVTWKGCETITFNAFCAGYRGGDGRSPKMKLMKYIIRSNKKRFLRDLLSADGFDERAVMPDAGGMEQWIRRIYSR
jgi:hypothetical protein